jgi:molecular chaperone GrpE
VAKVTGEGRKKGGEAKEDKGPSAEERESKEMKTAQGEDRPPAEEASGKESEGVQETGAPEMDQAEEARTAQEEGAPESEPDAPAARPEPSAEERVEELLKENEELKDKFVRLMADFDNYRKRASKEKSDVIQFGNEGLLKDFLPIIDNIERLLTYSYGEGKWKSFQEGIELLLAEIRKTLEKYGVEPIEALGKPFDPNVHQAMQRTETEEVEANTVLEVFQKGYLYRGRLLRPSLVVVAVPPKEAEAGDAEAGSSGTDEQSPEAGDQDAAGKEDEKPIN